MWFQDGLTRWTNRNPLVYYPWAPQEASHFIKHEVVDKHNYEKRWQDELPRVPAEQFLLKFYQKRVKTLDNKEVLYSELFPGKSLSRALQVTEQIRSTKLCYILSLYNPIKPYLKPILCHQKMLRYFFCEVVQSEEKARNLSTIQTQEKLIPMITRHVIFTCSDGSHVSSLGICDGISDCPDGSDESTCFCYVSNKVVKNSFFCATNCNFRNKCRCPDLYMMQQNRGCSSYKLIQLSNRSTFNNSASHVEGNEYYVYKDSSIKTNETFKNDSTKESFEKYFLDVNSLRPNGCSESGMLECYPGYNRCYFHHEKCIYNLTINSQTLMYCRNGKHLQDCENVQCSAMMKCPNSYCVPYRYVCDGKWDCWNGYDELKCEVLCKQLFKCKMSSTCIHFDNVCDDTADCPLKEDEFLCDILSCPKMCVCLNYAIKCHHALFTFTFINQVFNRMTNFVFISISRSNIISGYLNVLKNCIILKANFLNLINPFICESKELDTNLKYLSYDFNLIQNVSAQAFSCVQGLKQLTFQNNRLTSFATFTFRYLKKLVFLDVSKNMIHSLDKKSFQGLISIKFLLISGIRLRYVNRKVFDGISPKLTITDSFHICCMVNRKSGVCTAKITWPSSCNSLLSRISLKLLTWFMGIAVVIANMSSIITIIISGLRKIQGTYEWYVLLLNTCDLLAGLHILIIAIKDTLAGEHYVESDISWRGSFLCHSLGFISLLSLLLSALLLLTLSISRYNSTKNLFEVSKRLTYSTVYIPLLFACFGITVLFLRIHIENIPLLSSPLCILFGNTDRSIIQKFVTGFTSIYLFLFFILITISYGKLVLIIHSSGKVLDRQKRLDRQKAITTHLLLVGITNAICWVPTSSFYLVSLFVEQFPMSVLYWITLVILPVNSMLNPILFNFTTLKHFITRKLNCLKIEI